jgi:hypothetical protein
MKKSRHFIVGASALGLLVAASISLSFYVWQLSVSQKSVSLSRALEPKSSLTQKDLIAQYLRAALEINADALSGKISRAEEKKRALALTVPTVLRDRHLQWILAIDAGRDAVIKDMMQEYSALSLVK